MQVGDVTNLHEPIYVRVTFQQKCLDLSLRLSFPHYTMEYLLFSEVLLAK